MPMNPEIKAQWVAALRSSEYQQGEGRLQKQGKFCCLGVLCELAIQDGVDMEITEGRFEGDPYVEYDGEGSFLPWRVAEWAGILVSEDDNRPDDSPAISNYTGPESGELGMPLTSLNDGQRMYDEDGNDVVIDGKRVYGRQPMTFAEIADLIENDPDL